MKYPFTGSFRDCDGGGNPGGAVGYVDGVRRWSDASDLVQKQLEQDTGSQHDSMQVAFWTGLMRREHGALKYFMIVSHEVV